MAHLVRGAFALTIPLVAVILIGCSDDTPNVFVPDQPEREASSSDPLASVMPAAKGQVYDRVDPYSGVTSYHGSLTGRYDIVEDGTFRLQFLSARHGFFEYLGTYSLAGTRINLNFDDSNTAGAWRATGTFDGDCLTVEYNIVMFLADFEAGEYCRSPGT